MTSDTIAVGFDFLVSHTFIRIDFGNHCVACDHQGVLARGVKWWQAKLMGCEGRLITAVDDMSLPDLLSPQSPVSLPARIDEASGKIN